MIFIIQASKWKSSEWRRPMTHFGGKANGCRAKMESFKNSQSINKVFHFPLPSECYASSHLMNSFSPTSSEPSKSYDDKHSIHHVSINVRPVDGTFHSAAAVFFFRHRLSRSLARRLAPKTFFVPLTPSLFPFVSPHPCTRNGINLRRPASSATSWPRFRTQTGKNNGKSWGGLSERNIFGRSHTNWQQIAAMIVAPGKLSFAVD